MCPAHVITTYGSRWDQQMRPHRIQIEGWVNGCTNVSIAPVPVTGEIYSGDTLLGHTRQVSQRMIFGPGSA